jgi:hypothetical protein
MRHMIRLAGVEMTLAAAQCAGEAGADVAADVARVRGGLSRGQLLEECLAGADDDRVDGWHDYVRAVVAAAARGGV